MKYAFVCAIGTIIGYLLSSALGYQLSGGLTGAALAGAGGGFVAGLIRQKNNKDT